MPDARGLRRGPLPGACLSILGKRASSAVAARGWLLNRIVHPGAVSYTCCPLLSRRSFFRMSSPRASQALARFTVLDLTRVRAGPTCVRQLADWGANVVKIDALLEDAGGEQLGGPRQAPPFPKLDRNKRAISLNLKDPRGQEVFNRLVKQADVVVENFPPDVKANLGVDYESVN